LTWVLLIGAEGNAAVSLLGRKIIRRRVQHGAGKWLDSWFRPGAIEGIVRGARSPASRILATVDILAFAPGRDRDPPRRLSLVRLAGWHLPPQLRSLARDLVAAVGARLLPPRRGRAAFRSVTPPLHRLAAAGLAGARPTR
jgi:hypothetical protein